MKGKRQAVEPRPARSPVDAPGAWLEHALMPMAWVEGPGHVLRYVNPAFCRLLECTEDQLVGKPFAAIVPGQDDCLALLDQVLRTGQPAVHREPASAGKPQTVFSTCAMWPVPAGVMVQVTETAHAHEMTMAMNQALVLGSVRQHELTEAADTAAAMGREADARKNEFLAMLAHELRNPLAPIRYMLEVMKRADGNEELIKPALDTMERQVRQITRLVDDLLDVSRISRGKLQLRRSEVELASIIHNVVDASRPDCDAAHHALTVRLPPQPVYLDADPARLAQTFGNLLNNACKFTRPGGRIELTAEREGAEVVITVTDSGIGIPPAMLPRVFEMFAQGDQTLERAQGGLGIGLTLVRRLVEMHGGSVQAFSEGIDQGSTFVVRLPILAGKAAFPAAPPGEKAVAAIARRIVVADDNHDAASALSLLLQLTGHETHLAFDGMEAVEVAARVRPDVVLLDIGMPKLSGYDAARRIREQPWGKQMVLVALTGWGQDEDRKKTAAAGFDRHLVKPVEYADLEKLLAGLPAPAGDG